MGRIIFTMSNVGPVTEQPEAQPEGAEIVPGQSGNADGKWATSLWPCANICTACKTVNCFCCTLQEIAGYSGRNGCLHCCCPCLIPCLRQSLREKHGIRGSFLNDCLLSYFCMCCVVTQMSAETKKGQSV